MLISEIYHSKQGEGTLTGTPSLFLRTSGCNLRCGFCDTPFASWDPEGTQFTLEKIVQQCHDLAAQEKIEHIVITGGEPMIQKQLPELTQLLRSLSLHITIETAGTVFQKVNCDLMSISPKLSNSTPDGKRAGEWLSKHENTRHQPQVVKELLRGYDYQLKFVVDTPQDCQEIETYLSGFSNIRRERILMMPQGTSQEQLAERRIWLEPYCKQSGFQFSPRMHIQWYGNLRGT